MVERLITKMVERLITLLVNSRVLHSILANIILLYITFEALLVKSMNQKPSVSCYFSEYHAWTAEINNRAVRQVTDRHTQTTGITAPVHAQWANNADSVCDAKGFSSFPQFVMIPKI